MAHPRVSSLKSFFGPIAGLSVCANYPEHISNQKRDIATTLRRKLTLLSRAQMACLHSTAMSSIRWVLRPSRLIFGVVASISGARTNAKPVRDEPQQRLNGRESPSDGSRAAPDVRRDGQRRGSWGVAGSSGIDTTPDLGDVARLGIRYVAISRILGAEPKSR